MLRPSIRRCFPRRGPGPAPGDKTRPAWIASPLRRAATGGVNPQPIPFRLTPQVAFATATIALSVGGAAWYTNQDTLERSTSSSSLFSSWSRSLSGASTPGLQPSLVRQRWEETYARAAAWVKAVGSDNRLAIILAENWVELSEAKRTCAGLIASFVGVWIAWRLPARMRVGEWLAHQPLSGRAVTLLTSTFSHRVRLHGQARDTVAEIEADFLPRRLSRISASTRSPCSRFPRQPFPPCRTPILVSSLAPPLDTSFSLYSRQQGSSRHSRRTYGSRG